MFCDMDSDEWAKKIPPEIREYLIGEFGGLRDSHLTMAKYNPAMLEGFAKFRRAVQPGKKDPEGALPKYMKEIISVVIEVVQGKGGDPKTGPGVLHTQSAVRHGATPEMIHETMAIVFFLAGMTSYVQYGLKCVKAAEEETMKLKEKASQGRTSR
jgi:alkylhydroperoxidase/carboxymuconolactone decarboxylase family protein YurZ